jgi:hypothetical protein
MALPELAVLAEGDLPTGEHWVLDPRVTRVRVQLAGEQLELSPVADLPEPGLSFFAALLPRTAALVSVTAIGTDGRLLEPQELSGHKAAWQRFRRDGPSS